MTKRPSPERLKEILLSVIGNDRCTRGQAAELFAEIDYLRGQVEDCTRDYWAASEERKQIREERDLLKERLGPAGAKMLLELKEERDRLRADLSTAMQGEGIAVRGLWPLRHEIARLRSALENICKKKPNSVGQAEAADMAIEFYLVAYKALALAKPGEDK